MDLHGVCTGFARGLHVVRTGCARLRTGFARGLHRACTGSFLQGRTMGWGNEKRQAVLVVVDWVWGVREGEGEGIITRFVLHTMAICYNLPATSCHQACRPCTGPRVGECGGVVWHGVASCMQAAVAARLAVASWVYCRLSRRMLREPGPKGHEGGEHVQEKSPPPPPHPASRHCFSPCSCSCPLDTSPHPV